jgi:membrane-associated protein
MESILYFDPQSIIKTLGYIGVFLIVFAESGILIGMFFPGDSLLFTAGLLSSLGTLNILLLIPIVIVAAILGDSTGYWIGKTFGSKIFNRDDSVLFSKKYVERAQSFYERYGARAIILARFVPIVRTVVPSVAGVASMKYRAFLRFNIIGGVLWGVALPILGFYLGKKIPNIDHYLLPITFGIIIVSFIPVGVEVWRARREV